MASSSYSSGLTAVTILVPPVETPTTAAEQSIDNVRKKYVDDASAEATKLPEPTTKRSASVDMNITVGGESTTLKVVPEALPDLLIARYCSGGWRAIQTLFAEIYAHLPGLPLACQSLILKNLAEGATSLNDLIIEAIVQVAHDLVDGGRNRIHELHERLNDDLARYGLKPISTKPDKSGGAEGGPEGEQKSDTSGGAGGGPEDADQIGVSNPGDPKATPDLCKAVRELYAARQRSYYAQSEPTEGTSAFLMRSQQDIEAEKVMAQQASKAYTELVGEISSKPRNHPIAPAVLELVAREGPFKESGPDDAAIERVAYQYLKDTLDLTNRALPSEYPYSALRAAVTPVEGPVLRSTQPKPGENEVYPETRAAFWAMEGGRGYAYEPLNDEALMLKQLRLYVSDILNAPDKVTALASALRFQALGGLIEARDKVEQVQRADRESKEGGGLAAVGQAAALLDLIGLFFSPAEVVGGILGTLVIAGTGMYLAEDLPKDVERLNSQLEEQAARALLASEYATTARALAARTIVASVVKQIATEFATVVALSTVSRAWAVAVRVWLDFQAINETR